MMAYFRNILFPIRFYSDFFSGSVKRGLLYFLVYFLLLDQSSAVHQKTEEKAEVAPQDVILEQAPARTMEDARLSSHQHSSYSFVELYRAEDADADQDEEKEEYISSLLQHLRTCFPCHKKSVLYPLN